MRLPKSIKVGAWEYQIRAWSTRDAGRENFFARADHATAEIEIDTAWGQKQAAASLLHEILHCIWKQWRIEESDTQERMVETLERGLSTVWHDNPEVMRWIGAGLKQ